MKKLLGIISLSALLLFAVSAMAHEKVVVVPIGKKPTGNVSTEFVLEGQTFSNASGPATGTMPNNGAVIIIPGDTVKTIPIGYHNGSGTVSTDVNLIPANIKDGVTIFGQTGTYTEEATSPMSATDLRSDKIGYVNGTKITGNMPTQNMVDTTTTVSAGYYDATDLATVDADLIAENICSDTTLFGIQGTISCLPTKDCNGDRGGTAYLNNCPVCVGGNTGFTDFSCITSTNARVWMDRNLGASQVATNSNDELAYGDLYQWGRLTDGHEIRTSPTITTLSTTDIPGHSSFIDGQHTSYDWRSPQNDNLWQGASGINNPCPSGFRLPTEAEWETERLSWSSNNSAGAYASPLKLLTAGFRSGDSVMLTGDEFGSANVSSSTVDGESVRILIATSGNAFMGSGYRANGYSVRCIKD